MSQLHCTALHLCALRVVPLQKAAAAVSTGAREVVLYVRQGPTGVSVLCVIGGLATIISSFLGLINVLGLITPISYLVNFYTLMFGFMTVFLEV